MGMRDRFLTCFWSLVGSIYLRFKQDKGGLAKLFQTCHFASARAEDLQKVPMILQAPEAIDLSNELPAGVHAA